MDILEKPPRLILKGRIGWGRIEIQIGAKDLIRAIAIKNHLTLGYVSRIFFARSQFGTDARTVVVS